MKKFHAAVLAAFVAVFAASPAFAAPSLPSKPSAALKVHDGTQTIGTGKDSYTVTAMGGKVVSIAPAGSMHGMGGSMMGSKTVKFTKSSKNGICYYWWYSYGRYYYVWRYC